MILINQITDETTRVLNHLKYPQERKVIHTERKDVMYFFLKLYFGGKLKIERINVRKLAQLLEYIFEFRRFDQPSRALGSQTIETELYEFIKELREKGELR